MVTEKEVDVRTEATINIAEPPGRRRMLGDLSRQIAVLNSIQDTICPLFTAPASGLTEDIPYKRLLR